MEQNGADYSMARPGGAALKAAGYTWVARYLCTSDPKRLSATERDDLLDNNLSIVLVFEDDPNQAANGYAQGMQDAQEALQQANALSVPDTVAIYFAADWDVPDYAPGLPNTPENARAKLGPIASYFDGVTRLIDKSRIGGYGGYWLIKRLLDAGLISYSWQAIAWSGGATEPRINIFQDGSQAFNGGVDNDVSKAGNFGQWSNQQGAQPVIVADGDNWFYRFNKAMVQIRNRQASRDELTPFVGQDSLHMFEAIMDNPEAEQATADQELGFTARTQGWQSQLTSLQDQVATLTAQANTSSTTISAPTPVSETVVTNTTSVNEVATKSVAVVTPKESWFIRFIKFVFNIKG